MRGGASSCASPCAPGWTPGSPAPPDWQSSPDRCGAATRSGLPSSWRCGPWRTSPTSTSGVTRPPTTRRGGSRGCSLEARVDQVLLTGDVTHRGLAAELTRYERIFAPLLETGRLVAVPGNHDRMGDDAARGLMRGGRVAVTSAPGLHVVRVDSTAPHNRSLIDGHGALSTPGRGRRPARAGGGAPGRAPGRDAAPPRPSTPRGGPGGEAGDAGGASLRGRAPAGRGPPGPDPGPLPARAPRPQARSCRVPRRASRRDAHAHPQRRELHDPRTGPVHRPRRGRDRPGRAGSPRSRWRRVPGARSDGVPSRHGDAAA